MKLKGVLGLGVVLTTTFVSCQCKQAKKEEKKRPNILFIMTDDHSYQTLSAYDNRFIETPNLDRIAKEGMLYTNSFVSNSICAPSRAVMLTGKHSHMNGQVNNAVSFDGTQQTFPKLLHKAGYQTALVGKWHLKSDPTGFDYWNILPGQGSYYNPDFIEMGEKKRYEGYVTDITNRFAFNWLDNQRDKEKPFCLLLHHKAVHRTWQPDTAHFAEFAEQEYDLPHNFFDNYEGRQAMAEQNLSVRTGDMDVRYDLKMEDEKVKSRFGNYIHTIRMDKAQKEKWEAFYTPIKDDFLARDLHGEELQKWKYQRYMRDYLACVRSLDNSIGEVLKYLDEHGLAENTLVVYTSDQGFYMGEHGWFDKRFMYEQSMRTPLLMRLPGRIKEGVKCNKLVQNIDYAATFLDVAGLEVPQDIQGMSMVPLWEQKTPKWRNALYYHYYEFPNEHMVKRHYGIRTDRYKLIHFYDDIDVWELYDLKEDPDEMQNIYSAPENKALIEQLKSQLLKLQKTYKDTDRSTY